MHQVFTIRNGFPGPASLYVVSSEGVTSSSMYCGFSGVPVVESDTGMVELPSQVYSKSNDDEMTSGLVVDKDEFVIPPDSFALLSIRCRGSFNVVLKVRDLTFTRENGNNSDNNTTNMPKYSQCPGHPTMKVTLKKSKSSSRTQVCCAMVQSASPNFRFLEKPTTVLQHDGTVGEIVRKRWYEIPDAANAAGLNGTIFNLVITDDIFDETYQDQRNNNNNNNRNNAIAVFPIECSIIESIYGGKRQMACMHIARACTGGLLSNADWMGSMMDHIKDASLCDIVVPGAHDAGTYGLIPRVSDIECSEWFKKLVPKFIQRWAVTQGVCLYEQLVYGVRYLDMRIAWDPTGAEKTFRFVHTVLGPTLVEMLNDIERFSREHPREVIFVDFNHLYLACEGEEGCNEEMHQFLINHPISERSFVFGSRDLCEVTVGEAVESGKPIILLYENSSRKGSSPNGCHLLLNSNTHTRSLWPNTKESSGLLDRNTRAIEALRCQINGMDIPDNDVAEALNFPKPNFRPRRVFFILQGIFTPDTGTIVKSKLPGKGHHTLEELAVEPTSDTVANHVPQLCSPDSGVNVILVDFITRSAAIEVCKEIMRSKFGIQK